MNQVRCRASLFSSVCTLSFLAVSLATACGSPSDRQLVTGLGVGVSDAEARVAFELSSKIPLNFSGEYPLGCYGVLSLIPAGEASGFRVLLDFDLAAFADSSLLSRERTRNLPNGTLLPPSLSSAFASWKVVEEAKFSASFHLGPDSGKSYAGVSIDLPFVDASFPAGLAVSQELVDASGRHLGAATFYGPKVLDGKLVSSGGIFVVAELGEFSAEGRSPAAMGWHRVRSVAANGGTVCTEGWHRTNGVEAYGWHRTNGAVETYAWHRVNAAALLPDSDFEVQGPDADRFSGLRALYRLFHELLEKGRAAGSID